MQLIFTRVDETDGYACSGVYGRLDAVVTPQLLVGVDEGAVVKTIQLTPSCLNRYNHINHYGYGG
jgi:hypothetical protein